MSSDSTEFFTLSITCRLVEDTVIVQQAARGLTVGAGTLMPPRRYEIKACLIFRPEDPHMYADLSGAYESECGPAGGKRKAGDRGVNKRGDDPMMCVGIRCCQNRETSGGNPTRYTLKQPVETVKVVTKTATMIFGLVKAEMPSIFERYRLANQVPSTHLVREVAPVLR